MSRSSFSTISSPALERDSRKHGTTGADIDFALLVDGLEAEREQGITIDVAYRYFATPKRSFIVADTPGHEQYTRNMATGASNADLAILLIDARKGLLTQTHRHALIVSLLGIRHVVLAVNKIDLVDYDEATFRKIVAAFEEFAEPLGFRSLVAIPISARVGDNVSAPSARTPWHSGPALLPYLESCDVDEDRAPDAVSAARAMGEPAQSRFSRLCRDDRERSAPPRRDDRRRRLRAYVEGRRDPHAPIGMSRKPPPATPSR